MSRNRIVCPNTVARLCLALPGIRLAGRYMPSTDGARALSFEVPDGALIYHVDFGLKHGEHMGCDCGWDGYETSDLYTKLRAASDLYQRNAAVDLGETLE